MYLHQASQANQKLCCSVAPDSVTGWFRQIEPKKRWKERPSEGNPVILYRFVWAFPLSL